MASLISGKIIKGKNLNNRSVVLAEDLIGFIDSNEAEPSDRFITSDSFILKTVDDEFFVPVSV